MSHTLADALVKSQKLHKRKPADFYPTPGDVTQALLDFLQIPAPASIWEPACGDGAMSEVLKANGHEVYSTDLREDSGYGEEGGLDFLRYQPDPPTGIPITAVYSDWIITNPPFSVAEEFIRKALSLTPNVAMLLSNQYWHAATRLNLFRDHPPAFVLPLTWRPAFLEAERGSSPMMNVMWTVWQEGLNNCVYRPVPKPNKNQLPQRREFDLNQRDTSANDPDALLIDELSASTEDDLLI